MKVFKIFNCSIMFIFVIVLVLAFSISGESALPKRGGTLTLTQHFSPSTLDPHCGESMLETSHLIFNTLIRWEQKEDGSWGPAPELATDWKLEGKTLILNLREGVKFHDGSSFNAEVVKFNIERMMDKSGEVGSTSKSNVESISDVEIIDDYTVKLELKNKDVTILSSLSDGANSRPYMVSKKAVEEMGNNEFGLKPVGTGPMRLVKFEIGSHAILERTGDYWEIGEDGESLTYFDEAIVRFISDGSVKVIELRSGTLDYAGLIGPRDAVTLESEPHLNVISAEWQGTQYRMVFSQLNGIFKDNLELRQAVLYAINKNAIANTLCPKIGMPGKYMLAPGVVGYDESIPYYYYNPQKSKELLEEAGYPEGIEVDLMVINRETDIQTAEMVKQNLDEVGIITTISILDRAAYLDKVFSGNYTFGMHISPYRIDPAHQIGMSFKTGSRTNFSHFSSSEIDKLLEAAEATSVNNERHELYKKVQTKLFEYALSCVIWVNPTNYVVNERVKDFKVNFEAFAQARKAWIKE